VPRFFVGGVDNKLINGFCGHNPTLHI
jgi:hypothetical protein